jgi:glutathione synthase/RimK-type ligase-like ATP-grasp enzyme
MDDSCAFAMRSLARVTSSHAYDQWMTVVLTTCADLPDGDEDGDSLVASLAARGVTARWQVWNDPAAAWGDELVVVRSTWDYTRDRDAFVDWAHSVPRLANPADVIAWNSDKTYLHDLADAGVPVVPTTFVAPGETAPLPVSGEFVLKPSIGAGSRGAGRFADDAVVAAQAHMATLHDAGRIVLIQPYVADVDTAGETALIYLDGRFSHAIRKGAMLPPEMTNSLHELSADRLYVFEQVQAREASPAELAVGEQVIAVLRDRLGADLLYARVDLLPTPAGPVLIELEITEPSLFLSFDDDATDRFADAITARVSA